ncbi:tannase/feruloyl esterase family alpha/beta hydrolase [Altererythrobacter sp. CC-YST694]|uniref:tannase/feruloyl esterase family alpha/beta hydrolase n=1 Tax=Altererythrobacter sp. CC-YST694 TaxID=2755038 RepID=UPI001D01D59B|nr:tannase/feruloyl esterase family alpha/beta hydrolase [Altererythrobacter sp. CC-YST694]MCB5424998.1 tannase/feruloyl esterase family alpha/beta hydrolase [Altererythrobacter sp. CC-YST694]
MTIKQGQYRKGLRAGLAIAASAAAVAVASPAAAKDCNDLIGLKLDKGRVTSAQLVAPGAFEQPPAPFGPPPGVANAAYKHLPAFCRVQATLTPTSDSDIKVEVWLPASGWNGKFVGIGNGIWAGQLSYSELGSPLSRGYAVATTDTGHTGSGLTAEWAVGHTEKLIDFGHRAVHGMTVTAKAAIKDFYGKGPSLSFWNSCSTGGRQGLMAAFRYPEDYDAISAMAPANPMTTLMTQSMWVGYQSLRTPQSKLTPASLGLVHKAAVAKCDKVDGLADGLIARPDACKFDPGELLCTSGAADGCLNADQVSAMRAIYEGVKDPRSGQILFPGFPVGSEMQLAALTGGTAPFPVALTYMSMLVFDNQPGWDWRSFDYGTDSTRAYMFGKDILDVTPSDLNPFFARGGKLLLSHGWADGLIPATNTVQFYGKLRQTLSHDQNRDQLRLFMAPGMQHCSGGEGPSSFDTLGVIDDWATTGKAPERIVASRVAAPAMGPGPAAPALPPMTRPLCRYPLVPTYKGSGDVAEAKNFDCKAPPKA